MKRPRLKRLSLGFLFTLIALYLVLLIPGPAVREPEAGAKVPFAWNWDDYFSKLELSFVEARSSDPLSLSGHVDERFKLLRNSLDTVRSAPFEPEAEIFDRLEFEMFELAPLVAADPRRIIDYIGTFNAVRAEVKNQSRRWDMNSEKARHRIYRLLYGGRAAVEEVMLQSPKDSYPALILSRDEPSSCPAAQILNVVVRSGDILISRGNAPTSALIARGNDYPGNFSHAALVYVDESTHQLFVIESHIEVGVTVSTIEQYLTDKKLRVMILRPRSDLPQIFFDPLLPHKAALMAYEKANARHIPYDFEMDYNDNGKLFCSEVASAAYSRLGLGLWSGISNISSAGLRSWLAAFGIRHFETQEPSDLEYDPQLTIVAEWRDPETLYKDHLDNAVIDVMLEGAEAGERLSYD